MLGESIERRNLQHSRRPSFEAVINRVFLDSRRLVDENLSGSVLSQIDFNACNPDESDFCIQFSMISIILLYDPMLIGD